MEKKHTLMRYLFLVFVCFEHAESINVCVLPLDSLLGLSHLLGVQTTSRSRHYALSLIVSLEVMSLVRNITD